MKTNKNILRPGIYYAGLVAVVGGKMWYFDNNGTPEYYTTKKETAAAIRNAYKDNKPYRRAILAQLEACKGRAYFYN